MKIDLGKTRRCGLRPVGLPGGVRQRHGRRQTGQEAVADVRRQIDPARTARDQADEELPAKDVFEAADRGDEFAEKVVDDTAYYLAVGAMNLMHIIDPDMVVFAGGMIGGRASRS